MLSKYIMLVLLPVVAYCGINIEIKVDIDPKKVTVKFKGNDVAIISDQERQTFKLSDLALKNVSAAIFEKRCDDMYLREPTPWKTYYKYKWRQVQRTLKPIRAKVLSVKSEPVALVTHKYENRSNRTATYDSGMAQSVEESVSSNWSIGGALTIEKKINYDIEVSVKDTTRLSFASPWGKATTTEKEIKLGGTSNIDLDVPPHHGAVAKLMATRGTIKIEVEYEATLAGQVFCNFDPKFKGHFWYTAYLKELQALGKFPTSIKSVETVSIDFYTNLKSEVTNLYEV